MKDQPEKPGGVLAVSKEEPSQGELEVLKARQKLALTVGLICLVILIVAGLLGIALLDRWGRIVSVSSGSAGIASPLQAVRPDPVTGQGLVQTPVRGPTTSSGLIETPVRPDATSALAQTPVGPPVPTDPSRMPPVPQQPQTPSPSISPYVPEYLDQLRRIEDQRKKEANNLWLALGALKDLLGAFQGITSSGDLLEGTGQPPQGTALSTYDAYQGAFERLRQWLHQLVPPPECQDLHRAYDDALRHHIETVATLKQKVAAKDLWGVAFFGLGAQGRIDAALSAADSELGAVCARLGINKFFSIGNR
ncbi:MAG: hypothetical protein NZ959_02875 [Armatimonadetes bacterium]|nr:hypothetical protein [Armatimonadota bacterium]MDW8121606.1 hypothetical protein [Armatimonadota bacterium]